MALFTAKFLHQEKKCAIYGRKEERVEKKGEMLERSDQEAPKTHEIKNKKTKRGRKGWSSVRNKRETNPKNIFEPIDSGRNGGTDEFPTLTDFFGYLGCRKTRGCKLRGCIFGGVSDFFQHGFALVLSLRVF